MSEKAIPQITGNEALLHELRLMRQGGHLPHALLLHGAQGCGKKTAAKWFTMLAMCENAEKAPCGECKACRLIAEDAHPDVFYAEHSGKRGGFSVETVREIRMQADILPNNGDLRMFLFPDADGMSIQAQNALLKSVEEPPAHASFVFTAETAGVLLPTLLSRMTVKAVFPVTDAECVKALKERGYSAEDAEAAVQRFGGNIGKCISYLTDETVRQSAETAAKLTGALAVKDEYALLKLLSAAAADRDLFRRTLELFDAQIRDAAAATLHEDLPPLGCDAKTASALAMRLTPKQTVYLHEAVLTAYADLDSNVSAVLTASALCAALMNCSAN